MELTEEQAIDRSIDLWKWLADTGREKKDWPGWCEYDRANTDSGCFLCEYDVKERHKTLRMCQACPYFKKYEHSCTKSESPYSRWERAVNERDTETAKAFAKDFLLQLYELKHPTAPVEVKYKAIEVKPKYKEISKELQSRGCAVCIECGAIYEGTQDDKVDIFKPCPNCDSNGLYLILPEHAWMDILKRNRE